MLNFIRAALGGVLALALVGQAAAQAPASGPLRAEVEKGLLGMELYRVLRDHYPQVWGQMVDQVTLGLSSGDTIAEAAARIRPLYTALVASELPKANDEHIVEGVRVTLAQARHLRGVSVDACYALVMGDANSDFLAHIADPLIQEEQAWAARLFAQTRTAPFTPPAADMEGEVEKLAIAAYETLPRPDRARFMQVGGDFATSGEAEDRRIGCAYGLAMLELLLERPQAQAAQIFRALLKSE